MNTWRAVALCAQTDPELFFPGVGENPHQALMICSRCPVTEECLQEVLAVESRLPLADVQGVAGGMTAVQRRKAITRSRVVAA